MFVTVRAFAKINLGLHIGALRPDGFHELRTVFQAISLHDTIACVPREGPQYPKAIAPPIAYGTPALSISREILKVAATIGSSIMGDEPIASLDTFR